MTGTLVNINGYICTIKLKMSAYKLGYEPVLNVPYCTFLTTATPRNINLAAATFFIDYFFISYNYDTPKKK